MSSRTARVGDLAEQVRGVSYSKPEASPEARPGYLPILRAGNITRAGLVYDDLVYVPTARISQKQRLRAGDIVIAASSGSLDVVGKAGRVSRDFDGGFGAFCKVLRPGPNVDPAYLAHYFGTPNYRAQISHLAAGVNINNIRAEHLDELLVPLPPLSEQRRIAAILNKADELRVKRRAALAQLDTLRESIFVDTFGDPVANSLGWTERSVLGDVADIVSGVTKGRSLDGKPTRLVPYLAVSNVQDHALDLTGVKTIPATEEEITKYKLEEADLLLTEGGDPDKLGRGTLWGAELPLCIHQNHVFRVRLRSPRIRPLFLNWLVGSSRGKRYFLKSAKQTTGIASINMTQLKAFPLLLPPVEKQRGFENRVACVQTMKKRLERSAAAIDALFASLQYRAFRGEL